MKIAYLILAHKNPNQLARLVERITYQGDDIYIHIDKRIDIELFKQINGAVLIDNRIPVYLFGYSMVQATLNLIKSAFQANNYNFYCLLSGQDYPIKPILQFREFLKQNIQRNFIAIADIERDCKNKKRRYEKLWFYDNDKYFLVILNKIINRILPYKRKKLDKMKFFGGSEWWTLTSDCMNYILQYVDSNPAVLKFFKHTSTPDEMIFQTILMNSPLKESITNNNLRKIEWPGFRPKHPYTWRKSDFFTLQESDKFFARKFDESRDKEILDLIDREILKR